MDEEKIKIIKESLESIADDELLTTWKENNLIEHTPEKVEAARRILVARNIPLPEQSKFDQDRQKQLEGAFSEKRSSSYANQHTYIVLGIVISVFAILFSARFDVYGASIISLVVMGIMGLGANNKGYNPIWWIFSAGILGFAVLAFMPSARAVDINDAERMQRKSTGNTVGGVLSGVNILVTFIFVAWIASL